MPEVTLNLPASATPLANTNPVGDVRSAGGADTTAEDATTFASLLQDNLKATPEEAAAALLAGIVSDTPDGDSEAEVPLADPAQLSADLLAAGLMPASTLPQAEQLAVKPAAVRNDITDAEPAIDLPCPGRGEHPSLEGAHAGRQPAGIAVPTGTTDKSDGKTLPEQRFATEPLPESGTPVDAQARAAAQATDFRAHLGAAQRPATELAVATPISHPAWAEDVGHQITWLAEQGSSKAELVLTPPHLGRIEISLEIGSDLTSAQFVSASPQVREALEQAMPRLRDMLAGSGISLGEANVSSDHPSGERGSSGERGGRGRDGSAGTNALIAPATRRGIGLVDLFA